MRRVVACLLLAVAGVLAYSQEAGAQLFGERNLGPFVPVAASRVRASSPISGVIEKLRTTMASGSERPTFEIVDEMIGDDVRYVRGNREAADFVGSDVGDAANFVGSQQSGLGEEIRTAIDSLVIEDVPDVNLQTQPVIPPRMLLNAPRLQVGFDFRPRSASVIGAQLTQQVGSKLSLGGSNWIEVSVEDGVAILRGEVASARSRKLASILVGFEPGIGRVQNEVRLATAPAARQDPPPLPPPPAPLAPPPAPRR